MQGTGAAANQTGADGRDDEVWLEPVSWADRRGGWRWSTRIHGSVRQQQGSRRQVAVLDLSARGCRVQTVMFRPGQKVWIGVGTLEPRIATVAWTDATSSGLEFRTPLHPSVVEHFAAGARPG